MKENKKEISSHQNEIITYKEEITRLNDLVEKAANRKEDYILKEREREVKKLKNDIEEYRDDLLAKDKKISEL